MIRVFEAKMVNIQLGSKDGFSKHKKAFEGLEGVTNLEGDALLHLQKVLFEMLKDISNVCEKNGIYFILGGGSALGAVRHHGFIPWDDDIDINMPRLDFEKFKKIFDDELGDKYVLCTPDKTSGHGMSATQIMKKGTEYRSFNELSKKNPGICIDIFVMENTFNNAILRNIHGIACLGAGYMLTCRKSYEDLPYLKKYMEQSEDLKNMFEKKAKLGRLIRWIPLNNMSKITDRIYSLCKNNDSKYVTIPSGMKHYFGEMYYRKDMCNSVFSQFDSLEVRIPKDYNSYLTRLYGDTYMEVPPEGKRVQHPIMVLDFGENK